MPQSKENQPSKQLRRSSTAKLKTPTAYFTKKSKQPKRDSLWTRKRPKDSCISSAKTPRPIVSRASAQDHSAISAEADSVF